MTSLALLTSSFFNPLPVSEKNKTQSNSKSTIEAMPAEVMLEVFSYLPPQDLGRISCVCKIWENLSNNHSLWPKKLFIEAFPLLTIIDETDWTERVDLVTHNLQVDDCPSLSRKDFALITKAMAELQTEMTMLTMAQGLNMSKLNAIAINPKKGRKALTYFDLAPKGEVDKTHRVLLTNFNLENIENETAQKQKKYLHKRGFEMAGYLPQATLNVLNHFMGKKFNRNFKSRCDENFYSRGQDKSFTVFVDVGNQSSRRPTTQGIEWAYLDEPVGTRAMKRMN